MHQIDEVTNLADDAAAALPRVLDPVVAGDPAGVDAITNRKWAVPIPKEFFGGDRGRRKASIVANHQLALRLSSCGNHALQFFLVQGERLFDKHMLSQLQRAPREFGMCIVPRGNHD